MYKILLEIAENNQNTTTATRQKNSFLKILEEFCQQFSHYYSTATELGNHIHRIEEFILIREIQYETVIHYTLYSHQTIISREELMLAMKHEKNSALIREMDIPQNIPVAIKNSTTFILQSLGV
ncbi:MAG: hypothetical protein KIT27_07640 [Legionellales bacterium]|nr:hypothetical protein [Legionellales bacterium]